MPARFTWNEAAMPQPIELVVNGAPARVEVDPTAPLLDVLRNALDLTGPRFGCGAGQCGACSVVIDGEDVAACQIEVANAAGKSILTVEGLGSPERPHPLQAAFLELQAGQCGYCLSGMLMAGKALLDRHPDPTRAEIVQALNWHLCRCGAHNRILAAVELAARRMAEARA